MSEGFLTPADDDYKTGEFASTDEEIRGYGWLHPLNNAKILSEFLHDRAMFLGKMKRYAEAKEMILQAGRYEPDTPIFKADTALLLRQLAEGPLGDAIDEYHDIVKNLSVPEGTLKTYFENRKIQVRYFISNNTNRTAIEQATADLENELAQWRRELASDPAHPRFESAPNFLAINGQAGKSVRLAVAALPPPLLHGEIPPEYLKALMEPDLEDEGRVLDKLWMHYEETTPDWMSRVKGLSRSPPP
jgi:hypothetical protein